ncbi:MAG TPA: hypothetical protein VHY21_08205 [Pseudonocardiaceae bacterium]|jgi:hypothetical protein|nr:hypothetical protein [Pseudonocardiaceae bacterium]
MTPQPEVLDAEVISIDGLPYCPADQRGPAMTPHRDSMTSPERVAADVAILDVAQAVAKAAQHLANARTAIVDMEIILAEYNSRDGQCGCGCFPSV